MPDIFLSYSRADQARARHFADGFQKQGLSVWWDVTLRSGEAYDEVTEAALRSARAVVVLWSKTSVASRWVRAEATIADRNGTLVPVMIEACERPVMFELTQSADLALWRGEETDPAWQRFLADVCRLVVGEDAQPGHAPPIAASGTDAVGGAPNVAILPIVSRSDEDDDFAEDMSEELVTALSLHGYFKLIASATVANYRGSDVDSRVAGRELDARYVVQGSLRRSGANLRIALQLVEAATSAILWSSKYVRPLDSLAETQDDLFTEIASDVGHRLLLVEFDRARKKTAGFTAWERVLRSMAAFARIQSEYVRVAIEEARQAVALGPDFALGHSMLATGVATELFMAGRSDAAAEREVRFHIKRAIELDGDNPNVLTVAATASRCIGDIPASLRYAQRAVRVAPKMANAHYNLAATFTASGRNDAALEEFEIEDRLAPQSTIRYLSFYTRGLAHLQQGQTREAEAAIDMSLQLNPHFPLSLKWKAILATMADRPGDARDAIRRLREAEPLAELAQHRAQTACAVRDAALADEANTIFSRVWKDAESGTAAA